MVFDEVMICTGVMQKCDDAKHQETTSIHSLSNALMILILTITKALLASCIYHLLTKALLTITSNY